MPELRFDGFLERRNKERLRFAYVALTSAANDGGPVQAGLGITNRIAGRGRASAASWISRFSGPGDLQYLRLRRSERALGGPARGPFRLPARMEEAAALYPDCPGLQGPQGQS